MAQSFVRYEDAVNWIVGLVSHGIKPGLKRMEMFMEKLGHPERRLKFIHVAGTNGKGSTCAYLSEVLHRGGYDVGTFTSPYIEKFTNRMKYNGVDIEEQQLLDLANRIKPVFDEIAVSELGSPTMFEVCTAVSLLYFGTVTFPDYVVWETGLGGRLDSTNIVTPVVSIITNIGHDHMDVLGDTIEAVAAEKAGIIKSGVPVVCTVEDPVALEVIKRVAKERKSTIYTLHEEFQFEAITNEENSQKFRFEGPFRKLPELEISLNGPHQLKNASAAMMTLEVLRQYYALMVEDDQLQEALKCTQWAGRLELVSQEPKLILDGAHNPEGAAVLAEALKSTYTYKKLHFMIGMLSTKYHTGYLSHILPIVDTLIVTEADYHKKEDAAKLADKVYQQLAQLGRTDVEVIVETEWKSALELLQSKIDPGDLGVVSGTLYMISDVRAWILRKADSEKGW
ncbi:bifunctional folylpolyglutamate synthase/dihydrofolate synthase [Paenibacillus sp. N1-5-1-14]|uniref:bifunctional folylpolyglutamate synthase/dihydrofolate synthase n=1 Tax=Paenibacillus radicibacter TaxID=2972488 RepID=UPI002158EC15|nr:folylpolyglutamate synthase/dihydrofolate synthase family protein [Paenibacillus radicibacter]MCR8644152.1 bifunctional folylpolyglutamate synthase/dihydrofolate synthase [Paenibacillus radicibacter]